MENLYIVCIEDQREVLNAVVNDLAELEEMVQIEACESAAEAKELLEEIDQEGDYTALIIADHVMPGQTGIDFLIEVNQDNRFRDAKKLVLTGLATYQDAINAINEAAIDRFIEKPWKKEQLLKYVKILLTQFLLKKGLNYQRYTDFLDKDTLLQHLRQQV